MPAGAGILSTPLRDFLFGDALVSTRIAVVATRSVEPVLLHIGRSSPVCNGTVVV